MVILFVVSTWWLWPRTDARFVGRWGAYRNNSSTSAAILDLRGDGTGITTFPDGSIDEYFWSATSQFFTTSLKAQPPFTRVLAQITKPVWFRLTGRELYFGNRLVLIKEVTRDEIRLESPDGVGLTYRRLHESTSDNGR